MRLRALAKINLGLDILRKREDGYHEVRMIMQTIQMYDVLEMKRVRKPGISLSVNYSYIPNDERNLVYKAAKLLMDEFQVKGGVDIHLEKFIPVACIWSRRIRARRASPGSRPRAGRRYSPGSG